MGIPLWSSPPPKGLEPNPTSQDPPLSSSSSSSSSSASSGSIQLGEGGTGLLTIAEFLREHAPGDDTERHLNGLMRLRRRMAESGSERGQSHAAAAAAAAAAASPASATPQMNADEAISLLRSRSLFEHTPAGRARILGGMSSLGTASSPPRASDADASLPPVPTITRSSTTGASSSRSAVAATAASASPPPSNASHLAGHIQRIGELQDFVQATADIVETPNQGRSAGGDADSRTSVGPREARLRAMQNRIDFLASEFQLLRNTRRELRRVEEDALEIRNAAAGIVNNPSRIMRPAIGMPAPQLSSLALSRSGTASARAHRQIPAQRSRRTQVARRALANISDDEDTDPDDDYDPDSSTLYSTTPVSVARAAAALSTPSSSSSFSISNLPMPARYLRSDALLARVADARLAARESGQNAFETFEREIESHMASVRPEAQSPAIPTAAQRDAMIKSVVMRMQIESLPTGNTF